MPRSRSCSTTIAQVAFNLNMRPSHWDSALRTTWTSDDVSCGSASLFSACWFSMLSSLSKSRWNFGVIVNMSLASFLVSALVEY